MFEPEGVSLQAVSGNLYSLFVPCSDLLQKPGFPAKTVSGMDLSPKGAAKVAKFPVFFPVSRELGPGEEFARDCVHRQPVSCFLRFFGAK